MHNTETVQPGAHAVDRDGEMIGTVEQVGTRSFVVTKGLIFKKDLYIPFSAIGSIDDRDGDVRLNVAKDQIDGMGWDEPIGGLGAPDPGADLAHAGSNRTKGESFGFRQTDASDARADDTVRVPLHEERLRAETVRQQAGEVEVRRDVVEEQQMLDVPVTREEVDVRRYAVDRPASEARITETEDTIRVPVIGERVDLQKDVRVAEELEITKRPVTETRHVSDTVRREEVDIEREGDVNAADTSRGRTSAAR